MEDDSSYNGCQVKNFTIGIPEKIIFSARRMMRISSIGSARSMNFATCHVASFRTTLLKPEVLFVKEFYP
jgi:hypothetical protein